MKTDRRTATIVGILFILASASAIAGLLLYQPILAGPDSLANGASQQSRIALGALMELVLVGTAIGTAIGLFPVLRPFGERIALGHLIFRTLEAVIITVGIISVLSLLTLSKDFVAATALDVSTYRAAGTLLLAVHTWTFMMGPLLMLGVNTLMYSSLLFKSRLVPRPLAVLGLAGATLVFCAGMLVLFGVASQLSAVAALLALPVAAYEMILAAWLIAKGFNPPALATPSPRAAAGEILRAA